MRILWVEGKTVYNVGEMGKDKLIIALKKVFPHKDFGGYNLKNLRKKLTKCITKDKEANYESLDYYNPDLTY